MIGKIASFLFIPKQIGSIFRSTRGIFRELFNLKNIETLFQTTHKSQREAQILQHFSHEPLERIKYFKNQYGGAVIVYMVGLFIFLVFFAKSLVALLVGIVSFYQVFLTLVHLGFSLTIAYKLFEQLEIYDILNRYLQAGQYPSKETKSLDKLINKAKMTLTLPQQKTSQNYGWKVGEVKIPRS